MAITEPGSLDLDSINVRFGGIKLSERKPISKGNKFIVAEHFVDPEGKEIDEKIFDVSRMCYSLFIAPEDDRSGRHKNIPYYHDDLPGKTGRIVGGGLLTVKNSQAEFRGHSSVFGSEPETVRGKFSHLLLPELQKALKNDALRISTHTSVWSMNVYWLRFAQILSGVGDNKIEHYRVLEKQYIDAIE